MALVRFIRHRAQSINEFPRLANKELLNLNIESRLWNPRNSGPNPLTRFATGIFRDFNCNKNISEVTQK